jgi:hypothetical protein
MVATGITAIHPTKPVAQNIELVAERRQLDEELEETQRHRHAPIRFDVCKRNRSKWEQELAAIPRR